MLTHCSSLTGSGSCEPLIVLFLWTDQYNLVQCVLLHQYTLMYIHKIHSQQPGCNSCLNEAYLVCEFSPYGDIPVFRNSSVSALCLGTVLNSEINKNHKNAQNMALNWAWKGHLFTVWDWNKKQKLALFDLSWERAHQAAQSFHYSAYVHK